MFNSIQILSIGFEFRIKTATETGNLKQSMTENEGRGRRFLSTDTASAVPQHQCKRDRGLSLNIKQQWEECGWWWAVGGERSPVRGREPASEDGSPPGQGTSEGSTVVAAAAVHGCWPRWVDHNPWLSFGLSKVEIRPFSPEMWRFEVAVSGARGLTVSATSWSRSTG